MKIFIARHGRTNLNEERRLAGNSNVAQLIEDGIKHAENLAEFLLDKKIGRIFCSPLNRAIETATPISKKIGVQIEKSDALREFDFGKLDGKLENGEAFDFLVKRRSDLNFKAPDGESYNDVTKRVEFFLEKIREIDGKNILIVGHGGVNRVLLSLLLKYSGNMDQIDVPNNKIYIFDTKSGELKWVDSSNGELGAGLSFREGY